MLRFRMAGIVGHLLKDLWLEQSLLILEFEKSRSVEVAVHAIQRDVLEEVLAPSGIRQSPAKGSQRAANRSGNESVVPLSVFDDVFVITGKELITAIS